MTERSEQEYRELAARAVDALGRLPNVHSVGIGGREKAGRPTGELVVKVFVSTKRPIADLAPSERVPATFEGLGTDVVECPPAVDALDPPDGARRGVERDTKRHRPLRGGTYITAAKRKSYGTLGFHAWQDTPSGRKVFAITNYHVVFGSGGTEEIGRRVGQPDTEGSLSGCCSGAFGTYRAGYYDQQIDTALIELDGGTEYFADVEEIGVLKGTTHDITAAEAATGTYQVRKRGSRTLLTGGTVQAINVGDPSHQRNYRNGIRIKPNPDSDDPTVFVRFGDHGDSGSAIVNSAGEVVGLLFAGSPSPSEQGWTTALPIADLLGRFTSQNSITLKVATNTGPQKTLVAAGVAPAANPSAMIAPEIEEELGRSPTGRLLTSLWLRHGGEANRLINSNRKAAALWHVYQGPGVLSCLGRSAIHRDAPLPVDLDGKNLDICVKNIFEIFAKYGDDDLRDAAVMCRDHFPSLSGRSYEQLLLTLHDPSIPQWDGIQPGSERG
jgi:hypothetical protein